jgi:outer membrane protein OmpA-like peptidoglycan-associated protein
MKGVGGCDLFYCRKTSSGTWSKPENIGRTINTEGDELFPYFADNNTLYFSSDGHEGYGGLDVYVSKWNERARAFGTPENLGLPVNSAYDDISLAMYADRRSSYFSSNRPGLKSGDNIYFFKRHQAILDLRVIDSVTRKPIAGAKVKLDNEKDNRELATDEDGQLYSPMYTEADYLITASKEQHSSSKTKLNTTVAGEVDTFIRQLALLSYDTIQPIAVAKPPIRKRFDSPAVIKYEVNQAYEIPHFFYKLDEYKLNDMKRSILDNLVGVLKKRPTMDIRVQAHCDCRGSDDYNQVLSDNRAAEVVKYLIRKGISRDRLSSKGYGKRRPTVPCPDCSTCTDEQHAKNRVVEFVVVNI